MLWLTPFLLLATLLDSLAVPGALPNGVRPDLVLVLIVAWATLRGWEEGLIAGLLGGFFVDLTSAVPFGVNIFRLGALGLGAGLVMERLARTSVMVPVVAAVVGSLLGFVLTVVALQATRWPIAWDHLLLFSALPNSALTGLAMAVAFPGVRLLDRISARPAAEEGAF